jgi:hypothetical protein
MYTQKDILVITTNFGKDGLELCFFNLKSRAAGLLLFSRESLANALYSIGYITDFDAELICVPVPVVQGNEGVTNWISLNDFIRNNCDVYGNLDVQMATNLVVNYKNTSATKINLQ